MDNSNYLDYPSFFFLRKYGRKYTKCTTKTAKNRYKRIAKSLESQGCVGSNPTRSAIRKGSGHQRDLMPGYFFANGVVYGVVLSGQDVLGGKNGLDRLPMKKILRKQGT